ncbi:hypothetical protein BpHYR1_029889, partial [Brachionus plicatilis]
MACILLQNAECRKDNENNKIECRMLQLSKLHQFYSKTSLRRWPTRRSRTLQQANNLYLLRWETVGSHL